MKSLDGVVKTAGGVRNGALIEAVTLMSLLRGCVIPDSYRAPESLVRPLVLTEFGEKAVDELVGKDRSIRTDEAKLAVALHIGIGDNLLLDVEKSNLEQLVEVVHREILDGRILFVDQYSFDLAEEIFPEHQYESSVPTKEAIALLRNRPTGTAQAGKWAVGPWGCLPAGEFRLMLPETKFAGYRCERTLCDRIHPFHMKTSEKSPVNVAIKRLADMFSEWRRSGPAPGLNEMHVELVKMLNVDPFVDSASLLNLLGDALTDSERISVATRALQERLSKHREFRAQLGNWSSRVVQDPAKFCSELDFGELQQLFHLHSDIELLAAIEHCVHEQLISIPETRTKVALVGRWEQQRLTAELGRFGVRFTSRGDSSGVMVGNLLQDIYQGESSGDLAYVLDRPVGESLDSLISYALQEQSPEELVDLCLSNDARAARRAATLLHAERAGDSRTELGRRIKWYLGISAEPDVCGAASLVDEIESYLASPVDRSTEAKRGELSNIFVSMETVMKRSLDFFNWAMVSDHYERVPRFTFDPELVPTLEGCLFDAAGNEIRERPTFAALAAGFSRLAGKLESLPMVQRDISTLPAGVQASSRPFAFAYKSLYHDLSTESQEAIVGDLRSIGALLQDQNVVAVRNSGPGHGNNNFPADVAIEKALGAMRTSLGLLLESGTAPVVYSRTSYERGAAGQIRALYSAQKVRSQEINSPFWPLAPELPSSSRQLLLVPHAKGNGWGVVRFSFNSVQRGGARRTIENWPPCRQQDSTESWRTSAGASSGLEAPVSDGLA